jgi:GTP cyclohydrolase I
VKDIQNGPADVALNIDRVGVRNLQVPLTVRDKARGRQHTVARVDVSVDLPSRFKGTHMSRFVEALENWSESLDYASFKKLMSDVRDRLEARRAHIMFRFPYFLDVEAPATGSPGRMGYDCTLAGDLEGDALSFALGVEAPVMTVCPCSLAISDKSAHSQRAMVRIETRFKGFLWIEDLVGIAEAAGSSPVYPLLKRADEKQVTEDAFARPAFVEDVVRSCAGSLVEHPKVTWFKVEVESYESIHNHNAYASIEIDKEKSDNSAEGKDINRR